MSKCAFTLDHYREILVKAKGCGYSFESFKNSAIPTDKQAIFMRHDVDGSPRAALEMAQVEADVGVHSAYFFMLDCPLYRMGSHVTVDVIHQIRSMGHDIGRHVTNANNKDMDSIAKPFTMIEYSIHSPQAHHLGAKTIPRNTYDPRFFSDILYISDSRGAWRNGCVCQLMGEKGKQMQVLIHPEWWVGASKSIQGAISVLKEDAASYAKDIFSSAVKHA